MYVLNRERNGIYTNSDIIHTIGQHGVEFIYWIGCKHSGDYGQQNSTHVGFFVNAINTGSCIFRYDNCLTPQPVPVSASHKHIYTMQYKHHLHSSLICFCWILHFHIHICFASHLFIYCICICFEGVVIAAQCTATF